MAKINPIVVNVTNGEDAAGYVNEAIKDVEVDDLTITGDGINTPLSYIGIQNIPISWLKVASVLDADPLAGNIGFNNTDLSQVTEIYLSNTSNQPMDVKSMLAGSVGSGILIQQKGDDSKYIIFLTDSVTDNTTYYKFTITERDSGAIFDDGTELITTLLWKTSTGGGHIIQQDSNPSTQENVLNIITNGLKTVIENVAGVATTFTLKFLSMFDVNPTGLQDGDLFRWDETSSKMVPVSTAPDLDILPSSEVVNANGILNTALDHSYSFFKIVAKNSTGTDCTISIGSTSSGTDIVNAQEAIANADTSLLIAKDFFDIDNDTDLYVTSDDITGTITLYFTPIIVR